jgi:nicotinamidase-related amidase
MQPPNLIAASRPFLAWLAGWQAALPAPRLAEVLAEPAAAAVLSVDVVNGFCHAGPLASPRVGAIVAPVVRLLRAAHAAGVRDFAVTHDSHAPDAVEFAQFPPHCVRGTAEAQAVPALRALPFWPDVTVIEKNSIHAGLETALDAWLDARPHLRTLIVVGDCTDLCTYQLAMHLRLRANAAQRRGLRVILPADCVDTYDLPVDVARQVGALPHDGDLLHLVFLYSMALNGVEVVRTLAGTGGPGGPSADAL